MNYARNSAGPRGTARPRKGLTAFCVVGRAFLVLGACSVSIAPVPASCAQRPPRGLFVSVIQNPPVFSSRKQIMELVDYAQRAQVQDLFVQIYRANRAWFPSRVADASPYVACRDSVGEDPFALLIRQAHASGIRVHAWLNLLSLSNNADAVILRKYGRSILTRNLKEKKKLEDYKIDSQYFLEPGDHRVRAELSDMVDEILLLYPELDGIEFDYIRYPDKNPFYGFTPENMERFKRFTGCKEIEEGSAAWTDWKRRQVTELLEILVKRVRRLRPAMQVSTTGCAPYVRAYREAFQEWPSWLERGLVDFVTLMSYSTDTKEFAKYVAEAKEKADFGKVNVAVGAYTFTQTPEVFARQFRLCEEQAGRACVVFHYGSLLENPRLGDPLLQEE